MARPAEQMPAGEPLTTDSSEESVLLRWVERPGGRLELVELPLTPELFLDPQIGDKMVQGNWHEKTGRALMDLLEEHFRLQSDVLVTHDMKHLYGPGFPAPAPDLAVIRGIQDRDADRPSFDVLKEGLLPCLVIEVVSRSSARIRKVDVERKVVDYARIGISEYLIVDTPKGRSTRYTLLGYRLDAQGRYQPIAPDAEGRILSQTASLWFQVSADRKQVLVFEFPSGRRLLTPAEWKALAVHEEEARRAAEEARRAAEEARLTAEERAVRAETELFRLREELQRLRGES